MKKIIDIPNADVPVASKIREALSTLSLERKAEVLEKMTEEEFIDHRVDVFMDELERALHSNNYTPAGAEEIALQECMAGLIAE